MTWKTGMPVQSLNLFWRQNQGTGKAAKAPPRWLLPSGLNLQPQGRDSSPTWKPESHARWQLLLLGSPADISSEHCHPPPCPGPRQSRKGWARVPFILFPPGSRRSPAPRHQALAEPQLPENVHHRLHGGVVRDGERAEVQDAPQLQGLRAVGWQLRGLLGEVHDRVAHDALLPLSGVLWNGRAGRWAPRDSLAGSLAPPHPTPSHSNTRLPSPSSLESHRGGAQQADSTFLTWSFSQTSVKLASLSLKLMLCETPLLWPDHSLPKSCNAGLTRLLPLGKCTASAWTPGHPAGPGPATLAFLTHLHLIRGRGLTWKGTSLSCPMTLIHGLVFCFFVFVFVFVFFYKLTYNWPRWHYKSWKEQETKRTILGSQPRNAAQSNHDFWDPRNNPRKSIFYPF